MSETKQTVLDSGLRVIKKEEGNGDLPQKGQPVTVHYNGYLENGTKFDSSFDRNQPFEFPVGQGRVIKGWDEAFMDMKVGTHATLTIPPELGYGSRNMGKIPSNSTLIFDVELLGVK